MLQDHITVENRHKDFIRKVCETEIVYALKDETGFAISYSNELEYEDGEPVQIICFWSDEARAKSCIGQEWEHYEVSELALNDFMENWCLGMNQDGLVVGTDFDSNLFGYEAEPLEVILQIIEELKRTGKTLSLRKFESIDDLEAQIREILEDLTYPWG
ncbi:MAG: DUF2750 domain-containing protein [Chryseobacterium sp.]|jgi:hypothetical protein|uniref:DUF2750 domain-containing protein n=1 Tax=Chryseobacterium sp. TaxID=1871047 RepID=UPI0028224F22|nr:DUF2750 domain-containing protein [Chryseobacterium sp.]MDR2236922.1 DUF2750 domain-containing protein [Chryseobacterium sp.]